MAEGVTLEDLGGWRRTHTCGELRRAQAGETATLMGWVHRVRDLGGVLFVDLRDRHGLTQVVFRPERSGPALMARAARLGLEWVIAVRGPVVERPPEARNPGIITGEIEVDVRELKVLAAAETLPFLPSDEANLASEDLRLRYRYLDLRRPELARVLELRHRAAQSARAYLSGAGFLEVETPMLVKQTPEGARDYVVPSRVHPGKFYALPQSPQLYKQTLMIAGVDRYFQLARCLRDEALRADRQPEHTQIDLEMSFVEEEQVFESVEGLMAALWQDVLGVELKRPFPRLTFAEAMGRYGSDKPDVRFGLEIRDVTAILARSPRNVVANGAKAEGGTGAAIALPGGAAVSGTQLRRYEESVKAAGGAGLGFVKVLPAERAKAEAVFPGALYDEFLAAAGAKEGDAVVYTSGPWEPTLKALGALRTQLGQPLIEENAKIDRAPAAQDWRFLWVREFPLFEWDPEANRWAPRHHMFTMPRAEHLAFLESDPGRVKATLYDLVLNGTELGSGSIRIHRPDIQERVMKVVGLTHEQAHEKFGFLLEAYRYASPPHGGIGLGFDRIVMLMAGRTSIRDTIAFPKTTSAASLMDGCPSEVDPEVWDELRLQPKPRADDPAEISDR
ncbi:MAG TPA: aspartate--tRNA ligase [Terriglobales bacterium]|nr:aspartate--tRNA ligase [Terriglobales bacterium]